MPYIADDRRKQLDPSVEELQNKLRELGHSEGDLNYVISRLIGSAFQDVTRYHMIARVRGVLNDVGDEFYRRVAIPYEDLAIAKNGDIPEYKALSQRFLEEIMTQVTSLLVEAEPVKEETPEEESI